MKKGEHLCFVQGVPRFLYNSHFISAKIPAAYCSADILVWNPPQFHIHRKVRTFWQSVRHGIHENCWSQCQRMRLLSSAFTVRDILLGCLRLILCQNPRSINAFSCRYCAIPSASDHGSLLPCPPETMQTVSGFHSDIPQPYPDDI